MAENIVDTSKVSDEALALLLQQLMDKHEDNFEAVAHELNLTVIKPAGERAAAYMLRTHHRALYDALPVGDVDAFDMLKVVNEHLDKVSGAIRMLEATAGEEIQPTEESA